MARVLAAKAQELLEDLPPYFWDEPMVQALVSAYGNECQRVEDAAESIRSAMFPSQAADVPLLGGAGDARLLSMWETLLRLPVNPAATVPERRNKVLAHIRKRNSGEGSDWIADLSEALGDAGWAHLEGPGDYQVTITIPYPPASYTAAQTLVLARQITPAHIEIIVNYAGRFTVGVSRIGDVL